MSGKKRIVINKNRLLQTKTEENTSPGSEENINKENIINFENIIKMNEIKSNIIEFINITKFIDIYNTFLCKKLKRLESKVYTNIKREQFIKIIQDVNHFQTPELISFFIELCLHYLSDKLQFKRNKDDEQNIQQNNSRDINKDIIKFTRQKNKYKNRESGVNKTMAKRDLILRKLIVDAKIHFLEGGKHK